MRILAGQRRWQGNTWPAQTALLLEPAPQPRQVRPQRRVERGRQDRHTILGALGLANDDFATIQGKILHPQAQALQQTKPSTIEQVGDQPCSAIQVRKNGRDFATRQHDRQATAWRGPGYALQPGQVDCQHLPIQEQERLQRLVLGARTDLAVYGQMGQELLDLSRTEFAGMTALMVRDVLLDPAQVNLLRAIGHVTRAHFLARDFQQSAPPVHVVFASGKLCDIGIPANNESRHMPKRHAAYSTHLSCFITPLLSSTYS